MELRDSVVRNTLPAEDNPQSGLGVVALNAAEVVVEGSDIAANKINGVILAGTQADITSTVVRRTFADPNLAMMDGVGITAGEGTRLTIRQSALMNNQGQGLSVGDENTTAYMESTAIVGTTQGRPKLVGVGVSATRWSQVIIVNSLINENATGVFIHQGAAARLVKTSIIANGADNTGGGAVVHGRGTACFEQVAFVDNVEAAVQALSEGQVFLEDTLVTGTSVGLTVPTIYPSISAAYGSSVSLTHSAVIDNLSFGVASFADDSRLQIADSLIAGTIGDHDTGDGVLVMEDSSATIHGTVVSENHRVGIHVPDGSGQIGASRVQHNFIGVNITGSSALGEDVVITDDVIVIDNDEDNFASIEFALPSFGPSPDLEISHLPPPPCPERPLMPKNTPDGE